MLDITFDLSTITSISSINNNCPPTIIIITIIYNYCISIAYIQYIYIIFHIIYYFSICLSDFS